MHTRTYPWRTDFLCAVFETDHAKIPARISKATKAIDARLIDRDRLDDVESRAIQDARTSLATLKAEWVLVLVDPRKSP
jgi:hypothetical protein